MSLSRVDLPFLTTTTTTNSLLIDPSEPPKRAPSSGLALTKELTL